MLTFMNSKLPDDWQISDKQYHIFQIYWWGPGLYYSYILLVYMKSILNVKKHLTWLKLYLVIISALELKVNKQKNHLSFSTKNFWFFQNSSVPFHQVTFDHSISFVLLIDKPNEGCKTSGTFERNTLSTKKKPLTRKENNITPAKTNAPIA